MLPIDFVALMEKDLGRENAQNLFDALNQKPITSIRLNPEKAQKNPFEGEKIAWAQDGFYLNERPIFTLEPIFHAGAYYVQEASSMFLEQAFKQYFNQSVPLKVLDLCASPGGKSTHLLSLINEDSFLISNELIKTRVNALSQNIQKWGRCNVAVSNNDSEHFKNMPGYFDLVVVDAPCSGEGLFRKDLESRNEWSLNNVKLCQERQRRILANMADSVKEGGFLFYSTCTFNRFENEENIKWACENLAFESMPISIENKLEIVESQDEAGVLGYHFFPGKTKGEGFFMACLRKTTGSYSKSSASKINQSKIKFDVDNFVQLQKNLVFIDFQESVLMMNESLAAELNFIKSNLYLKSAGTDLGTVIKNQLNPSAALAYSIILTNDVKSIDLDKEDALAFLRKGNFSLPSNTPLGWVLVKHQGLGLGWVKNMGNRFNNYFPMDWRIRM